MTSFTAAYLLRLALWWLAWVTILGGPVWLSWRLWDRAVRRAHAEERHRVACGHFLALLVLPVAMVGSIHLGLAGMGAEIAREPPRALLSPFGYRHDAGSLPGMILGLWLVGCSGMAWGLVTDVVRLRRRWHGPAPEPLVDDVRRLGKHLRDRREITVRVADVSVPEVVGILRPVVVAPADFVRFPAAEREAVLLHELAHVARGDFLWNLLQRLTLGLLWFQPAAWVLYRQLARERETCCDRLAVRHGASAPALARALVRLAENRMPRSGIALAIASRGALGWRVQRLLVAPEAIGPTSRRWFARTLGTVALALAAVCGARLGVADPATADLHVASAFGPVVAVSARDPAGSFALRIHRGRVIEASVEHQLLARASIWQQGDRVTLLGATREPIVSFRVTPQGRIEWPARVAETPRD